jgi:hypothetical protein
MSQWQRTKQVPWEVKSGSKLVWGGHKFKPSPQTLTHKHLLYSDSRPVPQTFKLTPQALTHKHVLSSDSQPVPQTFKLTPQALTHKHVLSSDSQPVPQTLQARQPIAPQTQLIAPQTRLPPPQTQLIPPSHQPQAQQAQQDQTQTLQDNYHGGRIENSNIQQYPQPSSYQEVVAGARVAATQFSFLRF